MTQRHHHHHDHHHHDDLSHCLEAPTVLFDRCITFSAVADEPGICGTCGWLRDDHPDADQREPVAA